MQAAYAEAVAAVSVPADVRVGYDVVDGLSFDGDPGLLQRALVNLVLNAVGALEGRGGSVQLSGRREGDRIALVVSDDGPGFDPGVLAHAFEPLVTTRSKGTGLGLALVKGVVERHGVQVRVVANAWLAVPRGPLIERIVVDGGFDAADDWITMRAAPGAIVVTADIPLASRCVKAGAAVLAPNGRLLAPESVGMALATRNLMQELRAMVAHNRLEISGKRYPCAGVFGVVMTPGTMRVGDAVALV